MPVEPSQRYDVYFHLGHCCPACLNIAGARRGCGAGHARALLIREATLRVRGGGQAAARRQDQRNVHAFVRDTVEPDVDVTRISTRIFTDPKAVPIFHNPLRDFWGA